MPFTNKKRETLTTDAPARTQDDETRGQELLDELADLFRDHDVPFLIAFKYQGEFRIDYEGAPQDARDFRTEVAHLGI